MSIEIKYFRRAGYALFEQKVNEEILKELKVVPFDEKLRKCK